MTVSNIDIPHSLCIFYNLALLNYQVVPSPNIAAFIDENNEDYCIHIKGSTCASQPDFMPPSLDDTLTVGLTVGPLVFQSLPTIRFSTPVSLRRELLQYH